MTSNEKHDSTEPAETAPAPIDRLFELVELLKETGNFTSDVIDSVDVALGAIKKDLTKDVVVSRHAQVHAMGKLSVAKAVNPFDRLATPEPRGLPTEARTAIINFLQNGQQYIGISEIVEEVYGQPSVAHNDFRLLNVLLMRMREAGEIVVLQKLVGLPSIEGSLTPTDEGEMLNARIQQAGIHPPRRPRSSSVNNKTKN